MLSRCQKGFVLIFACWVLGLLTFIAVSVAVGVRQKALITEKMEERNRMYYLQEAALKQTKAYIVAEFSKAQMAFNLNVKVNLTNNPSFFSRIMLANDWAEVNYTSYDQGGASVRYGVVDEESKLNLNTTTVIALQRLMSQLLDMRPEDTVLLSQAVVDWRQAGQSQADGFFSQDYYRNLKHSYFKKDANFELMEELLLIKGMNRNKFEKLLPYVTVYGEGKVNINTATAPVLYALGLEQVLVDKLLMVRRGKDGIEGTLDDHFFLKVFDVASDLAREVKLDPAEVRALDALNLQQALTTQSFHFKMQMQAHMSRSGWSKGAQAIISSRDNKVLYWREK